jgi:hypothetical protein
MATNQTAADRAGAICPTHGIKHDRGNVAQRSARRAKILSRFAFCVYCGATADLEMDRIIPACVYSEVNVVTACRDCNNDRGMLSFSAYVAASNYPTAAIAAATIAAANSDGAVRPRDMVGARVDAVDAVAAELATIHDAMTF